MITRLFILEHARTSTIHLPNFYIRRALRLLPCLCVVVVVGLIYSALRHSPAQQSVDRQDGLTALLYLTNWQFIWQGSRSNLFGHTWSLAIEEQFYLLWGAGAFLLLRHASSRRAAAIMAILLLVSWVWRWALYIQGAGPEWMHYGLDTRINELFSGVLLALTEAAFARHGLARLVRRAQCLGLCGIWMLLAAAIFAHVDTAMTIFVWQPLCVASTVLIVADILWAPRGIATALSAPWLVYLGAISYGIYLWHALLNWMLIDSPYAGIPVVHVAVSGGLGVVLAAVSFHAMERPLLTLKPRLQFRASRMHVG